jgi:hypothetical protein
MPYEITMNYPAKNTGEFVYPTVRYLKLSDFE